jgi:hypothetical protein
MQENQMQKITLVSTTHRENGLCNPVELLKILRTIEPEVVFEETPPPGLRSLEAQAIAKYRDSKLAREVPVDRYAIPDDVLAKLRPEIDRVLDCVEQTSPEYLVLVEEIALREYQHGFPYLNSAAFATMISRKAAIEAKTISDTRDQALIRGLETWHRVMQARESAMIRNIYGYCRANAFDTGVFLVGAAHKTGVISEIAVRQYGSRSD